MADNDKIGFRVDGSDKIGVGHIVRCIAIAEELKKHDTKIYFITKNHDFLKQIIQNRFEILTLKSNGSLEEEINELEIILKKKDIGTLIIDNYNVSEDYFLQLKKFVKFLCYIDDLNQYKFAVDMIINGNIYAEELKYTSHIKDTKYLLGPKYTIFRTEFRNIKPAVPKQKVESILITFGGSDPYNLTKRIIQIISSSSFLKKYKYNVMVMQGFKFRNDILELKYDNINYHDNSAKISEIMIRSDLAISGGGSTVYELAICAVPTLAFIIAENQKMLVNKMHQLNLIENIGWHDKVEDDFIENKIKSLIENYELRNKLHNNCTKLFDGEGVKRIAKNIT